MNIALTLWELLAICVTTTTVVGLIAFQMIVKHYLPGYLAEKGRNLATKDDIAGITHKVEEVKNQYAMLVEQFKAKNQLRMTASEKRLQAHQDAFFLWRKLVANTHSDDVGAVVLECQTFWEQHCLYLEPAARLAFSDAYKTAAIHRELVHSGRGLTIEQRKELSPAIQVNWARINDAGQVIWEAVALPPLSETEAKQIPEPLP